MTTPARAARHVPVALITLLACLCPRALPAADADTPAIAALPGLIAWYRADHVALGGDGAVRALRDLAGKAPELVAMKRPPALVAAAVNGLPALRFAGGSGLVGDLDWSARGFTVIAVAEFQRIPGQPAIRDDPFRVETPGQALVSDGGVAGLALGLNWNGRPGMAAGISVADASVAADPPWPNEAAGDLIVHAGDVHAFAWWSTAGKSDPRGNAWDCRLAVDLAVDGLAAAAATSPFISTQAHNGGRRLQLGGAGDGSGFAGDLAELIVIDHALTAAERDGVIAALRARYALRAPVERIAAAAPAIHPTLDDGGFWFRDAVAVDLSTATADGEIRFTTDGSEPTAASPRYVAPVTVTATTAFRARTFAPDRAASPETTARFVRIAAAPPGAAPRAGGWTNSWSDEFEGPEVDPARWGFELGYVRNSEAQFYSDRRENSRIDSGDLLIQGLHDGWDGHEWTSAARSTEDKVVLTYGRYEMRAKIDVRSGSWPAWWLWSRPDAAGWPKEGEIDLMEYYTGKCLLNVIDGNGSFTTRKRPVRALGGERWAREYHVWTMEWDAERIDLSLDGTLVNHYRVADADGTGVGGANPYRHPETKKMVLNQALGGTCGGALAPADAPFELRVDWVRVHAWSDAPAQVLTVDGGIGGGPYVVGAKASITARMAPAGYVFARWEGGPGIADPTSASTIVTMPAADVTVTATYRPRPEP